jgi:hypothetical protein
MMTVVEMQEKFALLWKETPNERRAAEQKWMPVRELLGELDIKSSRLSQQPYQFGSHEAFKDFMILRERQVGHSMAWPNLAKAVEYYVSEIVAKNGYNSDLAAEIMKDFTMKFKARHAITPTKVTAPILGMSLQWAGAAIDLAATAISEGRFLSLRRIRAALRL